MRIIMPGVGVPFAGGIEHKAAGSFGTIGRTVCGLPVAPAERFDDGAAVWVSLCSECFDEPESELTAWADFEGAMTRAQEVMGR
jgi:hypothetical protein